MNQKIIIISPVQLPSEALVSSLASFRVFSLGQALRSKGHEVIYMLPRLETSSKKDPECVARYDINDMNKVIDGIRPNIIVAGGWELASAVCDDLIPLVIDMFSSGIDFDFKRYAPQIKTLTKADFLICEGERQKMYFLAIALMSGFNPELIDIGDVPLSFPEKLFSKKYPKKTSLISVGEDFSPLTIYRLMRNVRKEKKMTLNIITARDVMLGEYLFHGSGSTYPLAGPAALEKEYQKASVAVELCHRTWHTQLGFGLRTLEYMRYGLPVIYPKWGKWASLIEKYSAGWVIDQDDETEWTSVFKKITSGNNKIKQYGRNAQKLIKENFNWNDTIAPLDYFCRHPYKTNKRESVIDEKLGHIGIELIMKYPQMGISQPIRPSPGTPERISGKTAKPDSPKLRELKKDLNTVVRRWEDELLNIRREWEDEKKREDKNITEKEADIKRLENEKGVIEGKLSTMKQEIDRKSSRIKVLEEELRNYMLRKK